MTGQHSAGVVADRDQTEIEQPPVSSAGAHPLEADGTTIADVEAALPTDDQPGNPAMGTAQPSTDRITTAEPVDTEEISTPTDADIALKTAGGIVGAVVVVVAGVYVVKEFIEETLIPTIVGLIVAGVLIDNARN